MTNSQTIAATGEALKSPQQKGENGGAKSKPKTKGANVGAKSKAKTKGDTEGAKPRAKTQGDSEGTKSQAKTKSNAEEAKWGPKTKRDNEHERADPLYKYIGVFVANSIVVVLLSYALQSFLSISNDYVFAYILGPLRSVALIVVTIGVYSLFKSLDFGRVLPWMWALGGLGVVLDLNVFWPSLYADLAIPSKLVGVLAFVFSLFLLKFFFRKRGRIAVRKSNSMMTAMVVLFAVIGSIIPTASEFSYLFPDQLYTILFENMPTIGLMVLWPVDYLGISGEIGISNMAAYGSWLNDEDVVDIATATLKIASNMVAYAVIAFVLGWLMFGRRASSAT